MNTNTSVINKTTHICQDEAIGYIYGAVLTLLDEEPMIFFITLDSDEVCVSIEKQHAKFILYVTLNEKSIFKSPPQRVDTCQDAIKEAVASFWCSGIELDVKGTVSILRARDGDAESKIKA